LPTIVYDRQGLWATAPFPQRTLLHDKYGEPMPWVNPDPRNTPGINKFVLYSGGGDDQALRRELQECFGDRLSVFKSAPEFIEMISPSVSKGEAVAWLVGQLGVDLRQVLAIGDGENDVEMLQLAGIGVAVANAMPATKAAADVCVAANDESGVAEALRRFVL
jgi:hydroxymethylpyrimidine pyrophosphatase-like HAD family hydrolase